MQQQEWPDELVFRGPFPLCPEQDTPWALGSAEFAGLYLFTVKVQDDFRVLYVGEAEHVVSRIREHIAGYLAGQYWTYDPAQLSAGKLVAVWSPTLHTELALSRIGALHSAVRAMLPMLEVFVCPVLAGKTVRCRIESAIIQVLRNDPASRETLENTRLSLRYPPPLSPTFVKTEVRIGGMPGKLNA